MSGIQKAVAAALAQIVTVMAQVGVDVSWATPEVISTVGGIITILLVWAIPNKD